VDDFPMLRTVTIGCDTPGDPPPWRRDGGERKNGPEISAVIFGF